MLQRIRLSGLACALVLLTPPLALATQSAKIINSEIRQVLRAAGTIRVEVKQEYDLRRQNAEEMSGEDERDNSEGDKNAEDQPVGTEPAAEATKEKYSLPLAELAEEAVRLAGWKLVGPEEPAGVILTVDVRGTPVGANYIGSLSGFFYTGAELRGSVRLELGGKVVTETDISAEIPVATSIHSSSFFDFGGAPRNAPFRQTLPDYCEAVFTVIGRACGPGPVVAGMKLDNDDQQTGAGRALLEVGDASVEPALIELLGQGDNAVARLAAYGLGAHGGPAALPPLFAILRNDNSHAGLQPDKVEELVDPLKTNPDEIVTRAERGSRARERFDEHGPMHQAVEWALLQIESPDKFNRLTAALQEPDAVMLRRGAAVVLGNLGDQRAFEPLAAAVRDKEPLVRAAALAALGWLKDERAVDILLAASDDATGYVSKLARAHLAEVGQDRWDKLFRAKNRVDALLEGFRHPDPLVRAAAARNSTYRDESEILAGLAALLQADPRALVRESAAETLAETHDSNDSILALALGDADAATRRQALKALIRPDYGEEQEEPGEKKVGRSPLPETTLDHVFKLLAGKELEEEGAIILLARITGPGVADKLLSLLQQEHSPEALGLIARELARRGDKRAVLRLLTLLGNTTDYYASLYAADALVQLADPNMLDGLFVQLKSGTPAARRLVVNVLSRLREPRAIGPLIAAMRAGETARSGEPAEGLAGPTREALESLTGKSFATGEDWLRWWKSNAGKPIVLPPPKADPAKAPSEEPPEEKTGDPKEE